LPAHVPKGEKGKGKGKKGFEKEEEKSRKTLAARRSPIFASTSSCDHLEDLHHKVKIGASRTKERKKEKGIGRTVPFSC